MGVMVFQDMDPDDAFARDESIAEEMDKLIAEGRHRTPLGSWETDAEQVAETIAVGYQAEAAGE